MTTDEENDILTEIIQNYGIGHILSIGDIYTILREHYNNEILDLWASRNTDKVK